MHEPPDLNEVIHNPDLTSILGPIELCPQDRIRELGCYAERVIKSIFGDSWAFISDETQIRDLPVSDDLSWLERELGVPVSYNDTIVEIAERLKAKGPL